MFKAGGPTVALILNILRGYNFTSKSIESEDEQIRTYHRIIESYKYGNCTMYICTYIITACNSHICWLNEKFVSHSIEFSAFGYRTQMNDTDIPTEVSLNDYFVEE